MESMAVTAKGDQLERTAKTDLEALEEKRERREKREKRVRKEMLVRPERTEPEDPEVKMPALTNVKLRILSRKSSANP